MSTITYKKPTLLDIPAMQELVAPEIESGVILPRSNDE
ncbi:MAG: GNAT family N-acetyltransferase, partial [Sulfuricurvum sp.]|nr:GNAT family N-acetyltransferase [Sulfuricurvum sp.]